MTAELDRLLGEKVMGWKLDQAGCYWQDAEVVSVVPTPLWHKHAWHPTTSIEQAFMVAEKIGYFELHDYRHDRQEWENGKNDWHAEFHSFGETADTPAMAICLAAQKWLDAREGK